MYEDSRVLELALNLPSRYDIWEYGSKFGRIYALGRKHSLMFSIRRILFSS